VHCIDAHRATRRVATRVALGGCVLALAGCAGVLPSQSPAPAPAPAAASPAPAPAAAPAAPAGTLPSPSASRNWNEFKLQAARRMVAANPSATYTGKPQDVLLAIPVLEVELNGDGSIRRIDVLRRPGQAPETTQIAVDAVRRAGPFGDVSRLPRPWKFTEAFLFNDDRRFKPRTLDN
jgi:pyruvate/2-oxoglutarate dehydrogenase complex dihydrolipoamide acyltransferase (E2) component